MNFSQAEEQFEQLKTRFEAGELSEAELKARLEELMVQDEQGSWWVIGYESGRWYRHDGTNWVQADPPGSPLRARAALATVAAVAQESGQAGKVSARHALPGRPGSRQTPLVIAAAALIVLSIGGYYMLRSAGAKPAAASTPTEGIVRPVAVQPSPVPTQNAEPTAQASETPTPGIEFHVTAASSQVILYQGPDQKFGQVKSYPRGEEFTVLARDTDAQWLLVSASDGNAGWVYFQWVVSDFDLSLVPTPSVMPPPPPTATRKPKDSKPTPCSFGC